MICSHCKYYDTSLRICRRFPPAMGWAKVSPMDFCGEFTALVVEKKPEPTPAPVAAPLPPAPKVKKK